MSKTPIPSRDRHALYEAAVQCPEAETVFFDRIYRLRNGSLPRSLREDFCGTAAIAAAWVRVRPDNTATGVDLDRPTLDYGLRKHILPLGEAASRVRLIESDVRSPREPKVDVIAALNFSYWVFKKREELIEYFRSVRESLAPGGVFVLDIFGGSDAQALTTEKNRKTGFTYVWEQASFDPVTHETLFHIHFRFRDGSQMRRAFTYDWRFWTIPEVREALTDSGFSESQVYWEGTDRRTGGGNGVFRRVEHAPTCRGWIAYIVAYPSR